MEADTVPAAPPPPPPPPVEVAYDPLTGIPAEYNEYLPNNCEEFKRWKAAGGLTPSSEPAAPSGADTAAAGVTEGMAGLAVAGDGAAPPPPAAAAADAAAAPAAAPPKKPGKKKKGEPEVVLEITARGRKKSVTIISGMDLFGVKLPEASKLLGKKFACGSSVTKTAEGKEQVEVQGDVAVRAAAVILASYGGGAGGLAEGQFFIVENKKRRPAFGGEEGG